MRVPFSVRLNVCAAPTWNGRPTEPVPFDVQRVAATIQRVAP